MGTPVSCGGSRPPDDRRFEARLRARLFPCVALFAMACSGSSPTESPVVATLEIVSSSGSAGMASLIVHEMVLLEVTARSADGDELPAPDQLSWDTSDSDVATVSESGVVTAHARGEATIGVSVGDIRAEVALSVKARVRITPSFWYPECGNCTLAQTLGSGWLPLAIGDTLSLSASYVDIDGVLLEEDAVATWVSDNPDAVTVSSEGRIVALLPGSEARIIASADDGSAVQGVQVWWDVIAGRPATLRLAHAASGVGPVTFVHNKGAPVTLRFGESVEIPITSGVFLLEAEGLPPGNWSVGLVHSFEAVNREGAHLAVYAVGGSCCEDAPAPVAGLVGTWDPFVDVPVPDDSVRVRVIQGSSSALIVFLLPQDAPIPPYGTSFDVLVSCYFDPGNVGGYWTLPAGNRDFVLQDKSRSRTVRIPETLQAGRFVTYVLTQDDQDEWGIAAFPDP